ncbi:MAG: hypothetical protein KGH53_02610 [Candidatus Micrarchaeota archaeon]|nr:hypothetical protein [Candidatus Micrarchaeota archaeon]
MGSFGRIDRILIREVSYADIILGLLVATLISTALFVALYSYKIGTTSQVAGQMVGADFVKTFFGSPIITFQARLPVSSGIGFLLNMSLKYLEARSLFFISILLTAICVQILGKYFFGVFQKGFKSTFTAVSYSFLLLVLFSFSSVLQLFNLPAIAMALSSDSGFGTLFLTTVGLGYVLTKQQEISLERIWVEEGAISEGNRKLIVCILTGIASYVMVSFIDLGIASLLGSVVLI